MRFIMLACIVCLLSACGAEKPMPVVVAPEVDTANEVVAQPQDTTATEDSNADPVEDVEWSPNSTDTLDEVSESAIDLEMGDGYEPVHVNGEAPRVYEAMKCKTAKDCRGMRRPKMPGEKRCIKNTCVFVGKPLHVEDVIEVF